MKKVCWGKKLDSELKKKGRRKATSLNEIHPEVWKKRKIVILLRLCNTGYKQNTIEKWAKIFILPFSKKGDLGIAKNYRDITLTAIAVKGYNGLLRNHILPEIKISEKNSERFLEISIHNLTDSYTSLNHWRTMGKKSRGNTIAPLSFPSTRKVTSESLRTTEI